MKIVGNVYSTKHYDIDVFFSHTEEGEPVMFLRRVVFGRGMRYGLTVDNAWQYWQDRQAEDTEMAWEVAKTATACIGLSDENKQEIAYVAGVIENHLSDLLVMEPIIKKLTTEQLIEQEIRNSGLSGFSIKNGEGEVIAGDG